MWKYYHEHTLTLTYRLDESRIAVSTGFGALIVLSHYFGESLIVTKTIERAYWDKHPKCTLYSSVILAEGRAAVRAGDLTDRYCATFKPPDIVRGLFED